MGWIGWGIIVVIIIGFVSVMSLMKAASDADDRMIGDDQYHEE